MKLIRKTVLLSALAVSFLTVSGLVQARDLTIALRSEPSSMDPQFHSLTPNTQLSETIFDPLVRTDGNANPTAAKVTFWAKKRWGGMRRISNSTSGTWNLLPKRRCSQ